MPSMAYDKALLPWQCSRLRCLYYIILYYIYTAGSNELRTYMYMAFPCADNSELEQHVGHHPYGGGVAHEARRWEVRHDEGRSILLVVNINS